MINSIYSKLASGFAAFAMATLPVAAQAQQAQDQAEVAQEAQPPANNLFNIPANAVISGHDAAIIGTRFALETAA